MRASRRTSTPTDSRILAPQLSNPDPRTRSDNSRSRRGEAEGDGADGDRCKRTEYPEELQDRIESIFAAEAPQGRLRSARGDFSPAVSLITLRTKVLHIILQPYPPHVGQHRQPRHNRGSSPPGGGGVRDSKGTTAVVRVRVRNALRRG